MSPSIWDTLISKFFNKKFPKSPNLVTLVMCCKCADEFVRLVPISAEAKSKKSCNKEKGKKF